MQVALWERKLDPRFAKLLEEREVKVRLKNRWGMRTRTGPHAKLKVD